MGTRETSVNMVDKSPCSHGDYILMGGERGKKNPNQKPNQNKHEDIRGNWVKCMWELSLLSVLFFVHLK